ncbi:MAG: M14 family zinc carboxypeptidase, partial [Candidatus Zhuqueibacterota bacterium]
VLFYPPKKLWKNENPTVMVFAQQHGNEPSGKEALLMFLQEIRSQPGNRYFENLNLILLPMVNPDGNEAHRRRNNNGVDLNRNHVILTEPETQLLHALFEKYRPHVTLDVHEYGGGTWLEDGYIKDLGEQLDCLSNPAIPRELKDFALDKILWPTIESTRARGVKSNRYLITKGSPLDYVRNSTTDIDDGRNSFGIQHTLSFIVEGLNGWSKEDRIWQRGKHQLTLIQSFLTTCNENAEDIVSLVQNVREELGSNPPDSIFIEGTYFAEDSKPLDVTLIQTSDMREKTVTLPEYRAEPKAVTAVKRPAGYIIEAPGEALLVLVKNHFFPHEILASKKKFTVEEFRFTGSDTLHHEGRDTIVPAGAFHKMKKTFSKGSLFIPAGNIHATQIVQIFEPRSFYGLSHYEEYQDLLNDGIYRVYRVLK